MDLPAAAEPAAQSPLPAVAEAAPSAPSAPSAPAGRGWRAEWLTLVLTLLVVFLFASSTLPALMERHELRERRGETEAEIGRLSREVRTLQDWNAGATTDPQLRARLLDGQLLSPEAPGYRVLPDPETEAAAKGHGQG